MFSKIFAISLSTCLVMTLSHPVTGTTSETLIPFEERLTLPIHGNWCGPGHFGSSETTPCIDALDCACKKHDQCYDKRGTLNCKCDNDLVKALAAAKSSLAKRIRDFFKVSPCVRPTTFPVPKVCRKCVKVFRKKVCSRVPCGFTKKCKMLPNVGKKSSVKSYRC